MAAFDFLKMDDGMDDNPLNRMRPSIYPTANPAVLQKTAAGPDVSPLSQFLSILDMAGSAGGAYAGQSARNRMTEAQVAQGGPATDAGALRNVLHAGYVANGGSEGRPTNQQLGLPTFGLGPKAPDATSRQFAGGMQMELLKRLREGRPLTLSDIKGAGWGEKLAGLLALAGAGVATAATGGAAAPLLGPAAGYAASKWSD